LEEEMQRKMTVKSMVSLVILGVFVFALWGQKPDAVEMVKKYSEAAKTNGALMRQYSWKMRIEVTIKGDTKKPMIYLMRFDLDGKLQKTLLTAPQPKKKRRGLRKRIAKKKIAEVKKWANKLTDLVKRYTTPSPGVMLDFYMKASFTPLADGTLEIKAGGFLQSVDKATFLHDSQSQQLKQFIFSTTLDDEKVLGKVDYAKVSNGPAYAARTIVQVPGKKVTAVVENFDFLKQ
jgi:hypothetical protein